MAQQMSCRGRGCISPIHHYAKDTSLKEKLQSWQDTIDAGTNVLYTTCESSYFEWEKGSRLRFWRWPPNEQHDAQYGFAPRCETKLPQNMQYARTPKLDIKALILPKFSSFILKKYITCSNTSPIHNIVEAFAVEKVTPEEGPNDIRMVFNGTKGGLNDALFAPNFWLPTVHTLVKSVTYGSKFVDCDFGEFFLNFPLDKKLQSYSGLDLTPYKKELCAEHPELIRQIQASGRLLGTWNVTWMGNKVSPFDAVKFYYLSEEFGRGNHLQEENPMRWDVIMLNLPGNKRYNPAYLRIMKWDLINGRLAGDCKTYVDDVRFTGKDLEYAWQCAR